MAAVDIYVIEPAIRRLIEHAPLVLQPRGLEAAPASLISYALKCVPNEFLFMRR